MPLDKFTHSVTLDRDKCKGCTTCIKRCPTEAIRVRNGKAQITSEKCIDCGECIRVCPNGAKRAVSDKLEDVLGKYRWTVALPAPTLYGQFNNLDDMDYVLTGLIDMGFNDIFEVSRAAEIVSDYTRKLIAEKEPGKPIISSACPAVVRLIRVRFPELCPHVLPVSAPIMVGARMARQEAVEKTGFAPEEIGVVFITPCPAKVTDAKVPVGLEESGVDAVVSIKDIYKPLLRAMNSISEPEALARSGIVGISWATSGGEAAALLRDKYLAADGIENIINVLEEIEDDKLNHLDFIELNACTSGCVGGVLSIENPFVAKARIQRLRKYLPVSVNHVDMEKRGAYHLDWEGRLEFAPIMQLDDDIHEAMRKLKRIEEICATLPDLDCGSCGAPSCRALAEDIVLGEAKDNDCIFILRDRMRAVLDNVSYYKRPEDSEEEDPDEGE